MPHKRKPLCKEMDRLKVDPVAFIEALGPDYIPRLHPWQRELLRRLDGMTKDGRIIELKMTGRGKTVCRQIMERQVRKKFP